MKPRSKREILVCNLSSQLPSIAKKMEAWAFKNCIDHTGYRNKMWTHCLSCSYVWPTTSMKIKTEVCPGCGWKLKLVTTRKQLRGDWARFAVLDVMGDFQVIRYFNIDCRMKAKQRPLCVTREIMQHWMLPDGKFEIISAPVGGMGQSSDHFGSHMSLKSKRDMWKYAVSVYKIHPTSAVLPIFKRNGFITGLTDIRPFDLLLSLLKNSTTETLLKTKQISLLSSYLGDRSNRVYRLWPSVKICIRNGYIVKDAVTWLDYMDLLQWFAKDLRSVKYVCPANLKKEHDRLVKKKTEITKRQDLERRMRQAAADQVNYVKSKSVFFGISFTDKDLEIKVLESVQEFIEESETHKHCVYSNKYYEKFNSLVFSARVNGKPVETVEVSLSKMQIIQSRGLQNKSSPYNKQIVDLLKKNLHVIRKRYKQLKVVAA